jgi:Zn-dependent metalloprotease
MRRTVNLLFFVFCFGFAFAQSVKPDLLLKHRDYKIFSVEGLSFDDDRIVERKSTMGLPGVADKFVLKDKRKLNETWAYKKYTQFYGSIEVWGGELIIRYENGTSKNASACLYPHIQVDTTVQKSVLDWDYIKEALAQSMQAYSYPATSIGKWVFEKQAIYVIDRAYPNFSGDYRLAQLYHLKTEADNEILNELVFIDIKTGQLLDHFSRVHFDRVKGVARTKYYGEQDIFIDSIASDRYLLKDADRKVNTLNNTLDTFVNESKYWNQVNEYQNEVAGDVHYGASAYFDMMQQHFDWHGLDGKGAELTSVLHVGGKYFVNAFWDGNRANFGNGDCDRYGPLTTLAIVGHEFVHGFTQATSDLVYRDESGALNEAISDIFGKALEYYYDYENFNWLLGDKIRKDESVPVIRTMNDPNERNHPKFYGGLHWRTGLSDNGGVHSNSGVLNYWFYLLVEGGKGENERGDFFDVPAIGMEQALELVFNLQTAYLTSSSNYLDAFELSLQICQDMYGADPLIMEAVIQAWKAVGLFEGLEAYDLGIESKQSSIILCNDDIHYPEYIIRNLGDKVIPSGTVLELTYDQSSFSDVRETYILNSDLEAGDSLIYVFSTPMEKPYSANTLIYASCQIKDIPVESIQWGVQLDDEFLQLNNTITQFVKSSDLNGLDIELLQAEFLHDTSCGENEISRFRARMRNNGCVTIPEGDTLYFDVSTDKGDFSIIRPVYFDNEPGLTLSSTFSVRFMDLPQDFESYDVRLRYSGDIDESNNYHASIVEEKAYAPDPYHETFETTQYQDYMNFSYNASYVGQSLVDWKGNSMLAFYAERDHGFYEDCEDVTDFFDQYSFKSTMSFCIDAWDLMDPILSFEMLHLRNSIPLETLSDQDFATMLRVSFEGADDYEQLIYGQQTGQLIHYELEMPEAFSGEIEFEVLCFSKNETNLNNGFFDDRDMILIDDLRVFESGQAFSAYDESNYLVFPNPASDILRLMNRDQQKRFDFRIYNSLGQLMIEQGNVLNQSFVDISSLSSGIYHVVFFENTERTAVQSFIK